METENLFCEHNQIGLGDNEKKHRSLTVGIISQRLSFSGTIGAIAI
jgi:hypothetical protein